MRRERKALRFWGDSLAQLQKVRPAVRQEAGYQLDQVQLGRSPRSFKPMPTVGAGAFEIRVSDEAGMFRVFYVAKLADAVYVLHCFEKKTQKTDKRDIDIGRARYVELKEVGR
ncbi:type II toxin-antitoxin system RelE/ParE family toxin [Bosea caraganae]|uniref:Type II toxin-antitoxin system RelE/ParE family toxin n=1 Tax=Bosea caraganae TaxID=2763117 RepID=A0A370KZ10_9HYPH|nr:type II toxin-antitoxin system RelE/ParE family toxin [Bosea caraganae]RDJ20225.1 type II toxin-antitoxin system RelE/ParE family toxin [Bosea caraganae]RDJ21163.1 type II toxin-antitoxin system RelE/ParE family toxin [Bosea caraganae]